MKIRKPIINGQLNENDSIKNRISVFLSDEVDIEFYLFQNQTLSDVDIALVEIRGCIFVNCKFVNCHFFKADFTDIVFNSCDLSNCTFSECTFHRVEFESCKLTGSGFGEAYLRNTTFNQSKCSYIDLSRSNIKATQFLNCDMANTHISYSKLSAVFKDCSLSGSNLFHTPLHGLNFTSCNIEGICVAIEDLKGVIVNSAQAIDLSVLMGLVVER